MEKLTHQEEEVMLIIWQVKSGVIKDFLNRMEEPRPPYTTVASIVKNLEKKGYVQAKRYGNTYVYSPSIDEGEYKTKFLSGVVQNTGEPKQCLRQRFYQIQKVLADRRQHA